MAISMRVVVPVPSCFGESVNLLVNSNGNVALSEVR
jgi:hypothetical protein